MISHTHIPVFVCVKDGGMLRKRFDFRKHTASIIGQMYEILQCFSFKCLYWSLVDMYVKLRTSDRDYFLPFFNVSCAEVHLVGRQKSRHVYNVGITNDVNVIQVSKNDEVQLLSLSRDICEPMVGLAVKKKNS